MPRETLNWSLLQQAKQGLRKAAFVPMPGGQQAAPPAGDPMAAGGAPMDPSMMGGAPMDPAMMGGAPMDPAMMGGMPPGGDPMAGGGMPPMDPAAAGGMPPMDPAAGGMPPDPAAAGGMPPMDPAAMGGAAPEGQIAMSFSEFMAYTQLLLGKAGGGGGAGPDGAPKPATKKAGGAAEMSGKLDQILQALGAPPAAAGGEAAPAPGA